MANRITELAAAGTLDGSELLELSQLSDTVSVSGTTFSVNATSNSFGDDAAGFVAAGFAAGDRVNVEGFTDPANNLFAASLASVTTTALVIASPEGDLLVNEAAGDTVTITKWVTRRVTAQEIADLGGGGVGAIVIDDEGVEIVAAATLLNFVGAGVTATVGDPDEVIVTIPGAATPVQEWAPNFTANGSVYIPAEVAMTIDQGNAAIGTGTLTYEKSTTATPSSFTSTTLPATLEAGAWLRVIAADVTGFVATHLVRTA